MRLISRFTTLGAAIFFAAPWCLPPAVSADHRSPSIAIVIDDMGDRLNSGLRATELDGAVTCAILPGTPYSVQLAEAAYRNSKEVMLHLPMEAIGEHPLGPGGVTLHMTREEFTDAVRADIEAVPHVKGINNHMGSLLTRHPGHMQWLMQVIRQDYPDLFFVDSRTTVKSVAQYVAWEHRIPNTRRDVFLDDDPSPEAVAHQFDRLVRIARRTGTAIGIGHPYASTLSLLEQRLPELESLGIRVVPVSEIIQLQSTEGRLWHASLSPLRKVAKSSKPLPLSTCCVVPASKSLAPVLSPGR